MLPLNVPWSRLPQIWLLLKMFWHAGRTDLIAPFTWQRMIRRVTGVRRRYPSAISTAVGISFLAVCNHLLFCVTFKVTLGQTTTRLTPQQPTARSRLSRRTALLVTLRTGIALNAHPAQLTHTRAPVPPARGTCARAGQPRTGTGRPCSPLGGLAHGPANHGHKFTPGAENNQPTTQVRPPGRERCCVPA